MYTLRLILEGVIFLAMVKAPSGQDQLWLLFLDPGYKGAMHHNARLYVDPSFRDATSRAFDGTDGHGAYFNLTGDHLGSVFAQKPQPAGLFLVKNTRAEGQKKPCFDCGSAYTFRQQKDDFQWVNSLSEILKAVPRKGNYTLAEATRLREDIVAGSYNTDGLVLARIVIGQGEIRTYTLWDEKDDPFNLDPANISTYAFKKYPYLCDPETDLNAAVAQTIAIELSVPDTFTLGSRSLADETKPGRGNIVIKGRPGALVEVQLSSMSHDATPRELDFNAFYDLLSNPKYFYFLPLPRECRASDSGGACSPVRP